MIIDTDNYAASGITAKYLPGGEPHVELPNDIQQPVHFFAKIRTFQDFGLLLAVANALFQRNIKGHLFMPYLPGARQDRVQAGFALTPEIYASPMSVYFETVTCVDPHSEAAVEIYSQFVEVRILPLTPIIKKLIPVNPWSAKDNTSFTAKGLIATLAPDKGAVDRATEIAAAIQCPTVAHCTKKRDPKTGWITTDFVPDFKEHCSHYEAILLADDICDGGATFVGIADRIHHPAYNIKMQLYVTHGIFSKGFQALNQFSDIFTTDSFYRGHSMTYEQVYLHGRGYVEVDRTNIHVIDLLPFYLESLTP